jgi:hypothetical protein
VNLVNVGRFNIKLNRSTLELTDKEIDRLARLNRYQVIDFLEKQSDSEVRIRMLKAVHFRADENKEIIS